MRLSNAFSIILYAFMQFNSFTQTFLSSVVKKDDFGGIQGTKKVLCHRF